MQAAHFAGAAARVARRLLHVHLLLQLAVEEGRLDVELVQLHVVVRHARQQRSQGGVLADWSEDLGEVDALHPPEALGHQACFVALHVSVHVALGLEHPLDGYGPHARRRLLQRPSVVGCQRRDFVVHGLLPVLRVVRRQRLRHGCRVAAARRVACSRLLLHDPFEVSTDLFGYPYGPAAVPPPQSPLALSGFPVSQSRVLTWRGDSSSRTRPGGHGGPNSAKAIFSSASSAPGRHTTHRPPDL